MDSSKKRLQKVFIFFSFILILIALRIAWFTTTNSRKEQKPQIVRGRIEDTNGITLAYTKESSTIAIAPKEIYDDEQLADILSFYLNEKPTKILHQIYQKQNYDYFYLKRQIDNLTANLLLEKQLPGVYREYEFKRVYPGYSLASNLLGFVGRDQDIGLEGLERDYNEILNHSSNDVQGDVIQLTIDSYLQRQLDEELGKTFNTSQSKRAVGIMLNLDNGEILALSNFPNFDPNEHYKYTSFERGNWSMRLSFEPGSTVKILMAAILLAENAVSVDKKFNCDGIIHFGNAAIRCRQNNKIIAHGKVNLSEILQYSCNVGMVKAMQKVKPEILYKYLKKLGVGNPTNIFPLGSGELSGYFPSPNEFVPSSMYYMPIGQSFTMTPLQLITIGSAVVQTKKNIQPFILKRILNASKTETIQEYRAEQRDNLFSENVVTVIRNMMRKVVTEGTGRAAYLPRLDVIGKTGTGEKSNAKGYLNKYVVTFLGFYPRNNPKYGVLILFDEPADENATGGSLAAPVFRRFLSKIQSHLNNRTSGFKPED